MSNLETNAKDNVADTIEADEAEGESIAVPHKSGRKWAWIGASVFGVVLVGAVGAGVGARNDAGNGAGTVMVSGFRECLFPVASFLTPHFVRPTHATISDEGVRSGEPAGRLRALRERRKRGGAPPRARVLDTRARQPPRQGFVLQRVGNRVRRGPRPSQERCRVRRRSRGGAEPSPPGLAGLGR